MARQNHTHKYILRNLGTEEKPWKVYCCAFPDCTHHMPTLAAVKGKETICWQCGGKMVMNADIVRKRRVKPRCYKCILDKRKKKQGKIEDNLEDAISSFLSIRGMK